MPISLQNRTKANCYELSPISAFATNGPNPISRSIACFGVLLHRYTLADSVQLIIQVGQDRTSEREVRLTVSADATFADLELQCNESMAKFVYHIAHKSELEVRPGGDFHHVLCCDFSLVIIVEQSRLVAACLYSSTQNDTQIPSQLARHLVALGVSAAQKQEASIWSPDLLSESDKNDILALCRGTDKPLAGTSIVELFENRVASMPTALALTCEDSSVTYGVLNQKANQLAHFLRGVHVVPGSLVGTCFDNSIQSVVSILGILKVGAAYVLLDPHQPAERLIAVVEDARIKIVITQGPPNVLLSMHDVLTIDVSLRAPDIESQPTVNPTTRESPNNSGPETMAYVSYTSGSTGTPLGVLSVQGSVLNGMHETIFDTKKKDEVCCVSGSLNVGFQALGLFLPLLSGVPLVLLTEPQYKDSLLLLRVIENYRVSTLVLPTTMLRQLLSYGLKNVTSLQTVRIIQVGGSAVTADLVESTARLLPWIELRKAWGTTEIGGMATKGKANVGLSIGKPITNTCVYVVDPVLRLAPIGAVGELCVAAPHLALGYLRQPDLTAERFIADTFTRRSSLRVFRTRDLGRLMPNGEFEFLGRSDDEAKIRGNKVQPIEVEACLARHEATLESVVLARESNGEKRLIAWVVVRPGAQVSSADLREFLSERLPEYMVPAVFVFLEHLPLTETGKVDRALLPEPTSQRRDASSQYAEPGSPEERFLAAVWSELLGITSVGIHDHYLELGGDSLFAVQVMARVWDRYNLELPAMSLFEYPTIGELACLIRQHSQNSTLMDDSDL